MKKRLLVLGLVVSTLFSSVSSSAKTLSKTVNRDILKVELNTYSVGRYGILVKNHELKIKSNSKYKPMIKGKRMYVFDANLSKKIKNISNNKKVKISYQTISKSSKYYKNIKDVACMEYIIKDFSNITFNSMYGSKKAKKLIEKLSDTSLSDEEYNKTMMKIINNHYKNIGEKGFKDFNDYKNKMSKKSVEDVPALLKKSYVVISAKQL